MSKFYRNLPLVFKDNIIGKDKAPTRNEFVVSEKGKAYRARNSLKLEGYVIQIDNGVIKSKETKNKKCDKGLVLSDSRFFLIELKGNDVDTALKQLRVAYDIFFKQFKSYNYDYFFRAVFSKISAPKLHTATYKKFRQDFGKKFLHGNICLTKH